MKGEAMAEIDTHDGNGNGDKEDRAAQMVADRAPNPDPNERPARRWTHLAFERACRLTGLDNKELCAELAHLAGREKPLAGQTLYDWRRGINAVPFEIFAAACMLAEADPRAVIGLDPTLPENGGNGGHHAVRRLK
jgi:hypothetical protein